MKTILSKLRRCVQDYNMIQDGDRIAVGLSGGKDSDVLLQSLKLYQRFSPQKFELYAITVNMGLKDYNPAPLVEMCRNLDIPYKIVDTQIAEIVFDIRKEKNPCSLCAKMRRGAVHNTAKELGCNKVAFAHHKNDVIETFLMSLLYESRISTFSPVTYLSNKDVYLIRPLIYCSEKEIIGVAKKYNMPIVKNPCPANGSTERQYMKDLIKTIAKHIPTTEDNIFSALNNIEELHILDKEKIRQICPQNKNNK